IQLSLMELRADQEPAEPTQNQRRKTSGEDDHDNRSDEGAFDSESLEESEEGELNEVKEDDDVTDKARIWLLLNLGSTDKYGVC
ncbi:hypothetical protein M8C21_003232, partial [Ambrosia artemisiifolia]